LVWFESRVRKLPGCSWTADGLTIDRRPANDSIISSSSVLDLDDLGALDCAALPVCFVFEVVGAMIERRTELLSVGSTKARTTVR
jgi:hypothetical protein